jgi:hypothetical protein
VGADDPAQNGLLEATRTHLLLLANHRAVD